MNETRSVNDSLPDPEMTPIKVTRTTGAVSTGLTPGECRDYPEVPGYEILGILGHGGMGVVYRARQVGANRLVALKMIRAVEHASVQDRMRFQIETEAVARLQHPNIVQLYEVGEVRGLPFFSLEFCDGGTLTEQLKKQRPEPNEAAALIETLARAMHYAHLRGVVHRDLKPGNVLLGGAEHLPKITDFGLAKRIDAEARDISQSGAIMGTATYMAPEQAAGKVRDTGPAADVYALGALLYECLTGRPPFTGDNTLETLRQVLHDDPPLPSRIAPKTPRDLETICLKCLRKEPALRYASAESLADDLRRFQASEPVQARPVGRLERTWRWCKRNPLLTGLFTLIGISLILVTYFTMEIRARAREAAINAERVRIAEDIRAVSEQITNRLNEIRQLSLSIVLAPNPTLQKELHARQQVLSRELDRTLRNWPRASMAAVEASAFRELLVSWDRYRRLSDFTIEKALNRYYEEAFINAIGAEQVQFDVVLSHLSAWIQTRIDVADKPSLVQGSHGEALFLRKDDTPRRVRPGLVKGSHVKVFIPSLPSLYISHSINAALIRPSDNERGWEYDMAVNHRQVDDTTYEFGLRRGVRFQDGTPFDADAVVLNMEYFKKAPVKYSKIDQVFDRAEKIDSHTVRLHLTQKYGAFMNDLIWMQFYTRRYLQTNPGGWNGKVFCPNLSKPGPWTGTVRADRGLRRGRPPDRQGGPEGESVFLEQTRSAD